MKHEVESLRKICIDWNDLTGRKKGSILIKKQMQDLKRRMFLYAVAVGKLYEELPNCSRNNAYLGQLIRCSSSVGANYRAALRAKSTADFLNKLKIVEEEADESIYFLELIVVFNEPHSTLLTGLINEGTEILRMVVSSIKTTRPNMQ